MVPANLSRDAAGDTANALKPIYDPAEVAAAFAITKAFQSNVADYIGRQVDKHPNDPNGQPGGIDSRRLNGPLRADALVRLLRNAPTPGSRS